MFGIGIYSIFTKTTIMKVLTYCDNPNHAGFQKLKRSYPEIEVLPVNNKYPNGGRTNKIWAMYQYALSCDPMEKLMFVDAHDVLFLKPFDPTIYEGQIVFNAEKGCYPVTDYRPYFQETTDWQFLNSGMYYGYAKDIAKMLHLANSMMDGNAERQHPVRWDDQAACNLLFIASTLKMSMDNNCQHLQCYSFIADDDFDYIPSALYNGKTNSMPSVLHGNGGTDMSNAERCVETSVHWLENNWEDTVEFHKRNADNFHWFLSQKNKTCSQVNEIRTFVRENGYGFGEDVFATMWISLLLDMNYTPKLMEIGVFKGQSLALWSAIRPDALITGVSTFAPSGDVTFDFTEKDTEFLFDQFSLNKDKLNLVKGDSMDADIIHSVRNAYDLIYIDGGHEYDVCLSDLRNYAPMVKVGGYLVVDDCCNNTQVPNGWFGGIVTVTNAVRDYMAEDKEDVKFKFLFSLVHIRVFRRIS